MKRRMDSVISSRDYSRRLSGGVNGGMPRRCGRAASLEGARATAKAACLVSFYSAYHEKRRPFIKQCSRREGGEEDRTGA